MIGVHGFSEDVATGGSSRTMNFTGVKGEAIGPLPLREGMNLFLSSVGVTFRRDYESNRPRINKPNSRKDREQKISGEYFYTNPK